MIILAIVLIGTLSVIKIDVDAQSSYLCELSHTIPDLPITECPAHQSGTSNFVTASFGLAFLILAAGVYITITPPKSISLEKKEFKEFDLSKLDEDEKKVYETIKNNKGSMYQSDVIKETGFTKVKTSRLLDRLEQKGVLERKRRGMTNIVVLK